MELLTNLFTVFLTILVLEVVMFLLLKTKLKTCTEPNQKTTWFSFNDKYFFVVALLSIAFVLWGLLLFNFQIISFGIGFLFHAFINFATREPNIKELI